MPLEIIDLPKTPADALRRIEDLSRRVPVFVFKRSPTCGISHEAERGWRTFLRAQEAGDLAAAEIDVIAERDLGRGLVALAGVGHESPQVLLFRDGRLKWHASHGEITVSSLTGHLGDSGPPS